MLFFEKTGYYLINKITDEYCPSTNIVGQQKDAA